MQLRRLKEDLNLDSILNLVLLPTNYEMKIMKIMLRAIAQIMH